MNKIKPMQVVRKFFVVVDSTTGEALSESGDVEGSVGFGYVKIDGLDHFSEERKSGLGLGGKLLITQLEDCKIFKDENDAKRVAAELQAADPDGDFDVWTIVEHKATIFTLAE